MRVCANWRKQNLAYEIPVCNENPRKRRGFSFEQNRSFYPPILYIPVPQTGHLPFIAGLPFFIVTFTALGSSRFARHFTQYMVAIVSFHLLSPFLPSLPKPKECKLSCNCQRCQHECFGKVVFDICEFRLAITSCGRNRGVGARGEGECIDQLRGTGGWIGWDRR